MARIPLPEAFLRLPLAHRALHDREAGRIENSLSAIRAAIAAGYGIEIDVLLSSDGVPMVFHDDDLDRVAAATGPFRFRSAAELTATPLKGSTDTIPTFAQVLALVDGRVPLLVELKDPSLALTDTDGRLEAAVAAALQGYHWPVALMSFNPHSIAHLARLAPDIPRGLTTAEDPEDWHPLPAIARAHLREIADYDRTLSSFISHDVADLDRPRVAALKAQGAKILCWTVRSPEAEAKARRIADNITFESYPAALPA